MSIETFISAPSFTQLCDKVNEIIGELSGIVRLDSAPFVSALIEKINECAAAVQVEPLSASPARTQLLDKVNELAEAVSAVTPAGWIFYQAFIQNSTFVAPADGNYRVWCIGKCADGVNDALRITTSVWGGAGGGTAGMSCSELYFNAGDEVAITVTDKISSFGSYMTCTAGEVGLSETPGEVGTASGGNIYNLDGIVGGDGVYYYQTDGPSYPGSDGLNGGMKGGEPGWSKPGLRRSGGGGGGGSRLHDVCPYVSPPYTDLYQAGCGGDGRTSTVGADGTPYPDLVLSADIQLFGGGGGSGGHSGSPMPISLLTRGGQGTTGTPGVIIIERSA